MSQGKSGKSFSYDTPGGVKNRQIDRTLNSLLIELLTVRYSLPYSGDGTNIIMRIDERSVVSAPRNRNDVSRTVKDNYSALLKLLTIKQIVDADNGSERMRIKLMEVDSGEAVEVTV